MFGSSLKQSIPVHQTPEGNVAADDPLKVAVSEMSDQVKRTFFAVLIVFFLMMFFLVLSRSR